MSLGDSRIERVRGRLAIVSMLTVRVVDLCIMPEWLARRSGSAGSAGSR